MAGVRRVFQVEGRPFFPLGGQARNSSGYNRAEAERAFQAVKQLHGNTLEIPVYWEQVEPEEGRFDWRSVDELLAAAREYEIRLILLWFATWKNGNMEYAPAWVKRDAQRFRRVISPTGKAIWVLSSHCDATLEADRRAFTALCDHLHQSDGDERTVIALQIENEPGILASARDYGPEGENTYRSEVPPELARRLRETGAGRLYEIWQDAGGRESGTWPDVFGHEAAEILTAWSIARYIDAIAEAGKAVYDVPMYANAWLGETGWAVAGDDYPSGGPVSKVLDIYRWFAPHLDLIAPDIYVQDASGYRAICEHYSRDDNPLFVPESAIGGANAWNMFRALAEYNAIGYACFGIERMLDDDGNVRPEHAEVADSFRCASAAIPLLLRYQGTGRVHAVVQEEFMASQRLDLGPYVGLVEFGDGAPTFVNKDWRHPSRRPHPSAADGAPRGRGLVFQTADHEFCLVGGGYRLNLRRKTSPEEALDTSVTKPWLLPRQSHYLSVDEGYVTDEGQFVVRRRRNGDETDSGIWVEPDVGVVRALMCE